MVLDPIFFAVAVPAVLFAGVAKGGFANGPTFVATPILALVMPPEQAVALMLPVLMTIDATAVRVYWRRWNVAAARALLLGAPIGLLLGVLLFSRIGPEAIKLAIGLIAVGFVLYQLLRARDWVPTAPKTPGLGFFWGAVTGFGSFVTHAGGPPAAVHLLAKNLSKGAYQATTVLVFWLINLAKFALYLGLGLFDTTIALSAMALAPAAILGTLLGVWAHRHVPAWLFFGLAYATLTLAGGKLIWEALA